MYSFAETYKSYPNWKLLQILDNPDDYKQEAFEAAQAELNSRYLDAESIENAEAEYLLHKEVKVSKSKETKEAIDDVHHLVGDEEYQPISHGGSIESGKKQIRIIAIGLGLLSVFLLHQRFNYLFVLLNSKNMQVSLPLLVVLSSDLLLPIGVVMFGLRKKIGWYIVCGVLVRFLVKAFNAVQFILKDSFVTNNSAYTIVGIVFYLSLMLLVFWAINKKSVFQHFRIKHQTRVAVIVVILILSFLIGA